MISMTLKKNFRRLESYLNRDISGTTRKTLDKYGQMGVDALKDVTPVKTGLTRDSWGYEVTKTEEGYKLTWNNTNLTEDGIPVVVLLEYGHGTASGHFVRGRNFIRPALKPIIARINSIVKNNVKRKNQQTGQTESEVDET